MNRFVTACAGLVATLAVAPASLSAPSPLDPCEKLAAYARTLPDSAWAKGGAKALAPVLQIDEWPGAFGRPRFETELAELPWVKEAVDADPERSAVIVEHLAGTDVYMASTLQGSLHCQEMVFLEADPARTARRLAPPPSSKEELCWTQFGSFGQLSGRPAFVTHGTLSQTTEDEDIDITPWTGRAWGAACRLELRLRTGYAVESRYCGDQTACDAAGRIAHDIAVAYGHKRENDRDTTPFTYGPPPTTEAEAAVRRVMDGRPWGASTPDFPTFGTAPEVPLGFSYSGFALIPLRLGNRDYVAGIGHDGAGWREGRNTLLAVYTLKDGQLVPLASFVIPRSIASLAEARAEPATNDDND